MYSGCIEEDSEDDRFVCLCVCVCVCVCANKIHPFSPPASQRRAQTTNLSKLNKATATVTVKSRQYVPINRSLNHNVHPQYPAIL